MHQDYNCHKDYVNQLSSPKTVCYVDESFDETLICEKARNRQIFFFVFFILQNMQFPSGQGLTFWGHNNEKF